jgi:hypothetical protein
MSEFIPAPGVHALTDGAGPALTLDREYLARWRPRVGDYNSLQVAHTLAPLNAVARCPSATPQALVAAARQRPRSWAPGLRIRSLAY